MIDTTIRFKEQILQGIPNKLPSKKSYPENANRAPRRKDILKPNGRLVVVTFHSLEDRIVKSYLRRRAAEVQGGSRYAPEVKREGPRASFTLPKRSVTKPSKTEIEENPRSRSAKLRLAVRTDAASMLRDDALLPPRVPQLSDLEARL